MVANTETLQQVREHNEDRYKYGFVTEIEMESAPKGLMRDSSLYLGEKE